MNGAGGGGGNHIHTINGDTGSITGPIVTIYANNVANNAGATVKFVNSGTISTFNVSDTSLQNTYIGYGAGGSTPTLGVTNTGIGMAALPSVTTGDYNTAVGKASGDDIVTGSFNVCLGVGATASAGGNESIIIGYNEGQFFTGTETKNISIYGGIGAGESQTIRIGRQIQHLYCYIAGITGVTNSNAQLVTINSSTGQLGVTNGIVGTWTDVTGGSQQLAVGNGYLTDNAGGVTYTLPATASIGDQIQIVGKLGIATITPNTNQVIYIGSATGTVGVTGTAVATNVGDCISLRCTTSGASSRWRAESFVGNWTLS